MSNYPNEHPIDTFSRCIGQSRGIMAAIAGAYDDKTKEYNVASSAMNSTLWAIEDMLAEMSGALDKMLERDRK